MSFTRNRFHQVLITAAPPTGGLAGVSPGVAAADRFYWSQVQGYAAVLQDLTLYEGLPVQASIAVAGAVEALKRRMRTGGTTASILTTAVTLVFLDSAGTTTALQAPGMASTAATVDVTAGIAYNAPPVGICIKANADTEEALINLTYLD